MKESEDGFTVNKKKKPQCLKGQESLMAVQLFRNCIMSIGVSGQKNVDRD